jgi:hypothetical protein
MRKKYPHLLLIAVLLGLGLSPGLAFSQAPFYQGGSSTTIPAARPGHVLKPSSPICANISRAIRPSSSNLSKVAADAERPIRCSARPGPTALPSAP